MAEALTPTKPSEMLHARLNQPRVSLEYLREQMKRHRLASDAFAKDARNATSKHGPNKAGSGVTN